MVVAGGPCGMASAGDYSGAAQAEAATYRCFNVQAAGALLLAGAVDADDGKSAVVAGEGSVPRVSQEKVLEAAAWLSL